MPEIIDFRVTLPPREWIDPAGDGDNRFGDSSYLANYNRIYTREHGGGRDADAMVAAIGEPASTGPCCRPNGRRATTAP